MDIREELIVLQTIQVLLDAKLHKFQEIMSRLADRIETLEQEVKNDMVTTPSACSNGDVGWSTD